MKTVIKPMGLDVHKDTMVIAVADGGRNGEVRLCGEISADLGHWKTPCATSAATA